MTRYDGQFRLAHELHKHLHELMGWDGPLTHRQYECWTQWLNIHAFNHPSRTDHYLMQIATEQRRSYVKNPRGVKLKDFQIKVTQKDNETQASRDVRIQQMKQRWFNRMTAPITIRENGKVVDTFIPAFVKRKQIIEQQRLDRIKAKKEKAAQRAAQKLNPPGNASEHDGARGNRGDVERQRFPLPSHVGRGKPKDRKPRR